MKKKVAARKCLSLGILTFGIGAVGLPGVCFSTVLASETVVTQTDLDAKKAAMDKAQAEYDEALKAQQAARDVVVNARRALEDAQAKYDEVMAKYRTGFAGFLQWVIDTETDPAKVEDARNALEVINDDIKLYERSDMVTVEKFDRDMSTPYNAGNISRVRYVANWMKNIANTYKNANIQIRTDHQTMLYSMLSEIQKTYDGFEDNIFQDVNNPDIEFLGKQDYIGRHRSYVGKQGSYLITDKYNLPVIDYNDYDIPDEMLDLSLIPGYSANEVKKFNSNYNAPNIVYMSFSYNVSLNNENIIEWDIFFPEDVEGIIGENHDYSTGLYTLEEYADSICKYYDLVDPKQTINRFEQSKDDFDSAEKDLIISDSHIIECVGKLKDAQRDYDEAVALFEQQNLLSPDSSGISEPIAAATQSQLKENQENPDTEADAVTTYTVTETISHNESEAAENTEAIVPLHKPQSEEITFTEKEVEIADTGAVEASQDVQKNARNEQGVLAEVLTYIFNGGAIAFIIPSGFIRRKSDKEILV